MRLNHKIRINKVVLCETPGLWDKYADTLWGAPALFFNTKFAFSFLLCSFITVNSLRGEPSLGHTGVPHQSYFIEGQCLISPANLLQFGWITTGITKSPCFWCQYLIFISLVMCIWHLEGPGQVGQINNIKVNYILIEWLVGITPGMGHRWPQTVASRVFFLRAQEENLYLVSTQQLSQKLTQSGKMLSYKTTPKVFSLHTQHCAKILVIHQVLSNVNLSSHSRNRNLQ